MFAKGSFNKISGLNFFFDSGLVALTMVDGKPKQAAFTASKEKLISWMHHYLERLINLIKK